QLDQLAEQHAGTLTDHRIPGTPWLRNNRFLHSFQQQDLNQAQLNTLLQRMSQLAIAGLSTESKQIPASQLQHWQATHQIKSTPARFIQRCAQQLLRNQLRQPATAASWLKQLTLADSYSSLQRVFGLYPLAAIPFRWGVTREQQTLQQQWGKTQNDSWTAYAPVNAIKTGQPAIIRPHRDALNIPILSRQEKQRLFSQHAPTWLINDQSPVNTPGTPERKGNEITVDTTKPVTYTHLSFGRWQHQITTQLNYLIWFSERPALHSFDWVAGKHDAVIFRVHLDQAQNILAYDSIHLCGCWYRLFLPQGTQFTADTSYHSEPVIAEHVTAARQMQVYISRDTHQIIDLRPVTSHAANTRHYPLREFTELLQLTVFDRQGYVPGSERPERWFFWPMGVRNPGAVRRFGEHAVSFIGKRHFDDPYLLHDVGVR
ncbi:MAG: hypothetical protein ACPG51_20070, partial [Thiolinea sp.]